MIKHCLAARASRRRRAVALASLLLLAASAAGAEQFDIAGPPGSGRFGHSVTVLPNGKIVIADPLFDAATPNPAMNVGAVYLYDPTTDLLLGPLVGSQPYDEVGKGGITVLADGNFVVSSPNWDRGAATNAGAVTWCSGETGCMGAVSAENSLVGDGLGSPVGKVTALPNGNYVVASPKWDNVGATNAGAVTFCSGATGCAGPITAANSLTSSKSFTNVGSGGIAILATGDYVVQSPTWDQAGGPTEVGASTWCSGTVGCVGLVSGANSLVGTTRDDGVGLAVTPLSDGGYVVRSPEWDNAGVIDVGAATPCGASGCTGAISAANALHGTASGDRVGFNVVALPAGRYVVASPHWSDDSGPEILVGKGAVTFCDGASACLGPVALANSLVGETASPILAEETLAGSGGITVLSDGDYVVSSPGWDAGPPSGPDAPLDAGAVTWCSGTDGCVGVITSSNSLVGTAKNDRVGSVTALANGTYVVSSPGWDGAAADIGSVTWCGDATGCVGPVSPATSLVGSSAGDQVGLVTPLANGDFVVASQGWDDGAAIDAGAVTWCSGTVGCADTAISADNSLVGSAVGDQVGNVVALSDGGFVVASPAWDDGAIVDAGAVTWCGDVSSCVGPVSVLNSLVGTTAGDAVGTASALVSGDYAVRTPSWDNGTLANAGAVTFGNGNDGTIGEIDTTNSVVGTSGGGGSGMTFAFDAARGRLVVGRPTSNLVSLLAVPEAGSMAMAAAALAALGWLRARRS